MASKNSQRYTPIGAPPEDIFYNKRKGKDQYVQINTVGDIDEDEEIDIDLSANERMSPEMEASWLSKLIFNWLIPLLKLGNEKPLDFEDLYPLHTNDTATHIYQQFLAEWEVQLSREKPSVIRAMSKAFYKPFLVAALLKLVHDALLFVGPIVLHEVIIFLEDANRPFSDGLWFALIMFSTAIVQSLALRQYFFLCYRTGMRLRSATVSATFQKSLSLSPGAKKKLTQGSILNLCSTDAQRLEQLTPYLHGVWYSLLQITVSMFLLWREVGVSCLAGVFSIFVTMPLTHIVSKKLKVIQQELMKIKDERVRLTNEIFMGIKSIKLQAWEQNFKEKLSKIREDEIFQLRKYTFMRVANTTLWTITPIIVAASTFIMYTALGNQLHVSSALTSLALFDIIRFPLIMLPMVINNIIEAKVSLNRIQEFLLAEEVEPIGSGSLKRIGVRLTNASFRWEGSMEGTYQDKEFDVVERKDFFLNGLNLELEARQLVCIVGSVGSGKSSILSALIGDMKRVHGEVSVFGRLALVSQEPFIQNASVRDNILFGKEFNPIKYQQTLEACALLPDLSILPAGDDTEIGEKGINLSGGQKARIGLARAVYQDADIYLMDDPLSAVDAHVGKHLFNECIRGLLANKLRILVTNHIHFAIHADKVVFIDQGEIKEQGDFRKVAEVAGEHYKAILKDSDSSDGSVDGEKENGRHVASQSDKMHAVSRLTQEKREGNDSNKVYTVELDSKKNGALITTEERSIGDVGRDVYAHYERSIGGFVSIFVLIFSIIAAEGSSVIDRWWLSYWSEHSKGERSATFYLSVYLLLALLVSITMYGRSLIFFLFGLRASKNLHVGLLDRILSAPMSFFDTTPIGRITNRFSKDMNTVDSMLPNSFYSYAVTLSRVFSSIVVIISVTPMFFVPLIPIVWLYVASQRYYIKTSRELQRLDSISRSPLFAYFGETLQGLSAIRAYKVQKQFTDGNNDRLDTNKTAYFLTFASNCWLALRLELAGTCIVATAVLMAVLQHGSGDTVFAGMAGLSISFALSITQSLNWSVRMASDVESQMVAVERIREYSCIESEGPFITETSVPPQWPHSGSIKFSSVRMSYRQDLDPALKDINFEVLPGEKIGIVGRTGSGKSSLIVALMRLVELSQGSIIIDGVDIRQIGLTLLRNNLAVIPQDPVLFSGTIRSNLDPFNQHQDQKLWEAIRRSQLSDVVTHLNLEVSENGGNFSVGQRQLLSIARALLKQARVVILDEATASIDFATDMLIQDTIAQELKQSTVLTVAHRINTILSSNRILVMKDGNVAEFDSPSVLATRSNSILASLMIESGLLEKNTEGKIVHAEENGGFDEVKQESNDHSQSRMANGTESIVLVDGSIFVGEPHRNIDQETIAIEDDSNIIEIGLQVKADD